MSFHAAATTSRHRGLAGKRMQQRLDVNRGEAVGFTLHDL
jgi:hypothetical protein